MKAQKKAYLFALAAVACWSTIGSAFKLSLMYVSPVQLLLISTFTACLVLFIMLLTKGGIGEMLQRGRKDWFSSAFLGLLNPFLYYVVLLKAYDLLPAQMAGTLNYIWPLVLVLLSIPLLGQKIGMLSIFAIMISFCGIAIISLCGASPDPATISGLPGSSYATGIALAVGSAFFWALYWILNVRDQRPAIEKTFVNFLFGFFYTLLLAAFTGEIVPLAAEGVIGGIYIGMFEMGITFVLWLTALQYSENTARVSNLIYLSPFGSLIIIRFTVGETILASTVAGLALIVTGILMQQYLPENRGSKAERTQKKAV